MDKKTHNQIRQVLMNEMGLTREFIRAEVRAIVRETVAQEVARIAPSFHAIVEHQLRRLAFSAGSIEGTARKTLDDIVRQAVADVVRQAVLPRVSIQVGITENIGNEEQK